MEIATILVPNAFLVLGSCANMIKGLSWMAGGSTRSVFNLSFVRDNNIAGVRGPWARFLQRWGCRSGGGW
jgi:hypothetical protein